MYCNDYASNRVFYYIYDIFKSRYLWGYCYTDCVHHIIFLKRCNVLNSLTICFTNR